MVVRVMGGKLFQLSSVFLFTVALSACGGGGSSGGTDDDGSSATAVISLTPQKVTEENYYEIAQMAIAQLGVSGDSSASSVNSLETMSNRPPLLESMAVSAADCDSGSGTENDNFQILGKISNGDSFDSILKNCKSSFSSGGYILSDGRHKGSFTLTGDYLGGGMGTYISRSEYESRLTKTYLPPEPSFSMLLDGDITYDAERTDVSNRWRQDFKKLYIETKEDGVVNWSALITDSYSEWIDNVPVSTYSLKSKGDYFFGSPSQKMFSVKIDFDLTGSLDPLGFNGRGAPAGGTAKIFDKESPAIIAMTVNDSQVLIECDLNGDGFSEFTRTINTTQLFPR